MKKPFKNSGNIVIFLVAIVTIALFVKIPIKVNVDCNAIGFDYQTEKFVSEHTVKMKGTLWLSILLHDNFDGYCYIDSGVPEEKNFRKWTPGNARTSSLTKGKEIYFLTIEGTNPVGTVYESGLFNKTAIMRGYFVDSTAEKETEVLICDTTSLEDAVAIWHDMLRY